MRSIVFILWIALVPQLAPAANVERIRILVTNDNGIEDPKLVALARRLADDHEVWVVAPDRDRSGSGVFLNVNEVGAIRAEAVDIDPRIRAWKVDGRPADAIILAVSHLMTGSQPDLVVSGINGGSNLSHDWMFSGTIGAARIAALSGMPAIAVSGLKDELPGAVEAAVDWVARFVASDAVRGLEHGQYLTVGMPRVVPSAIRGVRVADRAPVSVRPQFMEEPDGVYRLTALAPIEGERQANWDTTLVENGFIAVTPMIASEIDGEVLEAWVATEPEWPQWESED